MPVVMKQKQSILKHVLMCTCSGLTTLETGRRKETPPPRGGARTPSPHPRPEGPEPPTGTWGQISDPRHGAKSGVFYSETARLQTQHIQRPLVLDDLDEEVSVLEAGKCWKREVCCGGSTGRGPSLKGSKGSTGQARNFWVHTSLSRNPERSLSRPQARLASQLARRNKEILLLPSLSKVTE